MVGLGVGTGAADVAAVLPSAEQIEAWTEALQGDFCGLSDVERIDAIRAIETLKCAGEAAQAVLTADFEVSQRNAAAAAGVPAARTGRGIGSQVALARRESPDRGRRHLGLARVLTEELPHTLGVFRAGRITEWKATIIARETACLTLADRRRVDSELAGTAEAAEALEALGDGELAGRLKQRAGDLDPASVAQRRRRAEADRHTSIRPAPDTMTWFGALLPVKDGVSVHAALVREADRLTAAGDPRGRGQIMADTLVARVLSPHLAAVADGAELPMSLDLVVPDTVLLGDEQGDEHGGGFVEGYGEVPGDLLREWIAEHLEAGLDVWLRRLYARPATGDLVAMDSKARLFPRQLAAFLRLRDRRCRTPWCDAPIRHLDHVLDHDQGGPTSAWNGQGLCVACNHAKQARGWTARPRPGPRHTVATTTPTGHTYLSVAPPTRQAIPVQDQPTVPDGLRLHLVHGGPQITYEPAAA